MIATFRAKWPEIKKPVMVATLLVLVVGVIIVVFAGYLFNWDWMGLGSYTSPPHPKDSDFQRGKTFWDWLQLLVIPVAAVFLAFWLNRVQANRERAATEQRAERDREIALDNQQETALQVYIDNISALLLHEKLRESGEDDEVRNIVRARTLTVLSRLDGKRKRSMLQFLYESGLIQKEKKIIDLRGADLSSVDFLKAKLHAVDLSGAIFTGASFFEADLSEANLSGANFSFASLSGGNFNGTNFSGAMLIADLGIGDFTGADFTGAIYSEEARKKAMSFQEEMNALHKWNDKNDPKRAQGD